MRHVRLLPIILAAVVVGCCGVHAHGQSQADVDGAIERMKAYLWRAQDPETGAWPVRQYVGSLQEGGDTALVTLALLVAGETPQQPRLRTSIDYLKEAPLRGTYAVGLRAQVWARMSSEYRPLLEQDAAWLLAAANESGQFGYAGKPDGTTNHSTTHYAVLGLWEAAQRGVEVPPWLWEGVEQHYLDQQRGDGGWGYMALPGERSSGSMTAAGLTLLLITQQQLHRHLPTPQPQVADAIDKGVHWLDEHFQGAHNHPFGSWPFYYLYAVERVGLSSGMHGFNGQDWYRRGVRYILEKQEPESRQLESGSLNDSVVDTAMALLFLARGRVPVWIGKLDLPNAATNQRPNDIHFLTTRLSHLREREMSWQLLRGDEPLATWRDAPAVYLSSGEAVALDTQQRAALRQYLDRGGVLLANPEAGSRGFSDSVRQLAATLYPQWPMRPLPNDHPIYRSLYQISGDTQPMHGVSNGARELILLADRDWGFAAQLPESRSTRQTLNMATNFWALITDRGSLPNLLAGAAEPRAVRPVVGRVTVGRFRYDGNWLMEPRVWEAMADALFNHAGVELQWVDVSRENLREVMPALVHVTGTDGGQLDRADYAALTLYAQQGGTVLVENIGGDSDFARDVEGRLGALFNTAGIQLSVHEPIVSGAGLADAFDNSRVSYRRYTSLTRSVGTWPRLAGIYSRGRPAVLFSYEDLSLGALGVRHWGIVGYSPQSARQLLANIVLWSDATLQTRQATSP